MNLVDSSAWLEFFANQKGNSPFKDVIEKRDFLLVPSVVIFEVFKKAERQWGEPKALAAIAFMKKGIVAYLDDATALDAAYVSKIHKLAMADSIILATAKRANATLWTMDKDFEGIEGVKYFAKK